MLYLPREESQELLEFAIIMLIVAIVNIAILSQIGPIVQNNFNR